MANNITTAQRYRALLDEAYKAAAKSSALDKPSEFISAGVVKYPKLSMQGLGNYSRSNGFVSGDATLEYGTMTLTQDRGRSFTIDVMDNEETAGVAFGMLAGEFIRTKVAPEIDAYTFAKLAGVSGIGTGTAADITVGTTDLPKLIADATQSMNENEVPEEGRILYISETAYAGLEVKVTRTLANENAVTRLIERYNNMPIIRVPQNRFNTAITMYDGSTSGQEAGGYIIPASTSYKINFMIVHPSAVVKVAKHVEPRIFDPKTNQQANGWKFDYRIYHDVFVYDNKVKGVYLHRKTTANS